MALIRWNPNNEIFNLHSELDRVFNEISDSMFPSTRNGGGQAAFLPLDISRTDHALEITASVPGFKPDEVSVTVDNGVLTIEAQHDDHGEDGEQDKQFVRRERYAGRLFRQVALGDGIDGNQADAAFKEGVLTVRVPLIAKPEPKRIPVSAAQ